MRDLSRGEGLVSGGYKQGANYNDVNSIRRMCADGKSVQEISDTLLIQPTCVESNIAFYKKNRKEIDKSMGIGSAAPKKAKATIAEPTADEVFGELTPADPLE